MAKKGSRKKKKTDPGKTSLQKLESRLFGYWKKAAWGEFVTLFQRHWSRAQNTQAAAYWQAAVFNLLVHTLFSSQDITLLHNLVHKDLDPQTLSEENARCLQVASAFCAVYFGTTEAQTALSLPSEVPPPFQRLAAALQETSLSGHSNLSEYVQGKRTKARKGEKHLALAARVEHQFNALRQQGFWPESIQPLTQLRKSINELTQSVRDNLGISSPALNNMAVLAELWSGVTFKLGNSSLRSDRSYDMPRLVAMRRDKVRILPLGQTQVPD